MKSSNQSILLHYHTALITITNTMFAVFMKCFPAFIPFVLNEYSFSYSFVTRALAIGSFTTMICVIITPPLLHFQSNIVFFSICIVACIGTAVLWYFRHQPILFIVGIALVLNVYQLQWGASNAMISSFVTNNKQLSLIYITLLNASWTFATFLFIPVGYILKYETFWSYLEWLFFIFAALSLLNLLLMPRISVNKYNQLHHSSADVVSHISLTHDFKILFGIKEYRLIVFLCTMTFITWSWYYTSFGYWIQQLYGLNESELGIAAALIEGIGNSIAILCITYLAESTGNDDTAKHNSTKSYKMKLENMMICFALLLLICVGSVMIINYIVWLQFLLEYKAVVYCLICGYFTGSEGVTASALVFSVTETPPSQQARSSAIISIIDSVTLFIGQITVGTVYTKGGFKLETPPLLSIQIMVVLGTIYLAHIMRHNRLKTELICINKVNNYPQYT